MGTADFLDGGGEMGALMRAHDWSTSSLGDPAHWPQSLRTAVRVLLNTKHPMYIFWGEDGACLYNDNYRLSIGPERHPCSLGRPAREVWDEIWHLIGGQIEQVMRGDGATWNENHLVPITRNGRLEDVYWTYSYGPIDDPDTDTGVGGVLVVCTETTEAVLAQQRQAFWIKLDNALRFISDPKDILAIASSQLGVHLGVGRCGYGEVNADVETYTVESDWTDGKMPSLAGQVRLNDFGPDLIDDLRAGRTVVLDDPLTDSRTKDAIDAFEAAGGLRAGIAVPLIKGGRLVAAFYVHQTSPRNWHPHDESLVRGVAERIWAALGRARAEHALRQREQELRSAKKSLEDLTQSLERQVEDRVSELESKELRLRTIFETSFQYQGLISTDGILQEANAAFLEGIGQDKSDVLGKAFWDNAWFAQTPGMPAKIRSAVQSAAKGDVFREEIEVRLPAGWRWFDFVLRPIIDEQNKVKGIVSEAVDTTERHAAEDALRQARKLEAMGQLTGGVAHDFNNLLTPIVGSLDLLKNRKVGGETEQKLIEGALQSADRAKTLVQRLLAFARRQSLKPEPVDTGRLVSNMAELVDSTTGPNIRVDIDIDDELPNAIADANQLELAVLNLAVNARDAMPGGGILKIASRLDQATDREADGLEPGAYIVITVSDTGCGMSAETLQRAVEPFFSTKGVGKGTGLGLSMVHGLASQLNGKMVIESTEGEGTTVSIWIPAATTGVVKPVAAIPSAAEALNAPVLLVDDEAAVRESTAEMLRDLGCEVICAPSASVALDLLDNGLTVEFLVTDYLMPGMTGQEMAKNVRDKWPDVRILLMTGFADMVESETSVARLEKPFHQADLKAALVRLRAAGRAQ